MKRYVSLICVLALWVGMTAFAWLKPADASSDSERRLLAQFPELSGKTLLSGEFMTGFADYAVDQFPLRDGFRTLNAYFTGYALGQSDNNGIYLHDGYAAKMEYPLNESALDYAADRFSDLYGMYLAEADSIHFAVVPDKGYYLAQEAGVLRMDYEKLFARLEEKLDWAEFIDLTDTLSIADYYRTDTHWRQESILPAAQRLAEHLDITLPEFQPVTVDMPFYGVYAGQAAMPMEPDAMTYLTWEGWEDCTVYSHDSGTEVPMYNLDKLTSKDPYELYLSGNMAVQTIENPNADSDRELVVFRDSFGSSMVPLLVQSYAKVTLVDTRYVFPAMVGQFVDFQDADVLFLYSTLVLNSGTVLRK